MLKPNWSNMLKIRGYDAPKMISADDPGTFEIFQGIGGGGSADDEDPGEPPETEDITAQLQIWLNQVNLWAGTDWEKWIDDTVLPVPEPDSRGARGDTGGEDPPPVTIPPQLPNLIDFISLPTMIEVFGPWGVVVFVGLKIVKRLLEAHLEKPGIGELQTVIEKAFLFSDGVNGKDASILKAGLLFADLDGKQKGALDRGLIIEALIGDPPTLKKISLLELLNMSVQDLALVDATIDFGAFRVTVKGKTIQYG